MAERPNRPLPSAGPKPVPMKLFATWEVDRTPPNCIPRLCSLTLSRLVILKPLGADVNSVTIAVKMQGLKRTLRSNEIMLPGKGLLDTELQLNFSLQYPHFLKRTGNKLHVSLQRRKRYKNRTILGYKTLAEGIVNMAQVLQQQLDMELELSTEVKEQSNHGNVVAKVSVQALNSQPVDHEETAKLHPHETADRGGDYSDEDEEFSSNEDGVEEAEGSDSEPMLDENMERRTRPRPRQRPRQAARTSMPVNARQRNLKQKFISLLKKFRLSEDLQGLEHDQEHLPISHKLTGGGMDTTELEDLMDELGEFSQSDSGPEVDTRSISSTPKPSLRPFFSSSRSLLHDSLNVPGGGQASKPKQTQSQSQSQTQGQSQNQGPNQSQNPTQNQTNSGTVATQNSQGMSGRPLGPTAGAGLAPSVNSQPASLLLVSEKGGDRMSDEGSRKADSDSHPENWTDHEASDPQPQASSPPKSGDDKKVESSDRDRERKGRLFARERASSVLKTSKKQLSVSNMGEQRINNSSPVATAGLTSPGAMYGDTTPSEPRKILLEQLSRVLPPDDTSPDYLVMVNISDSAGNAIFNRLVDWQHKAVGTMGPADIRAAFTCLINKTQKFCNSSAKPPSPIRVLLVGTDAFIHSALRYYVEQLSFKPPDWQNYLRFLIIPIGISWLARYISSVDSTYGAMFNSEGWRDLVDRADRGELSKAEWQELIGRLTQYLHGTGSQMLYLPVAEAMLTYKEKSSDEDSSQIFIPFMNDVRLGCLDNASSASVDLDEGAPVAMSGSPPSHSHSVGHTLSPGSSCTPGPLNQSDRKIERTTPPSSPNVNTFYSTTPIRDGQPQSQSQSQSSQSQSQTPIQSLSLVQALQSQSELMELQLDYWLWRPADTPQGISSKPAKPDSSKSTLKTAFRSLQVVRLPSLAETSVLPTQQQLQQQHLLLNYCTKEKKQKSMEFSVMRLGKKKEKEKESESGKSQTVDGVSRLICSPKIHNIPLKVSIDGTEWYGVKFFQLSAQWQTHVKHFPVALLSPAASPAENTQL